MDLFDLRRVRDGRNDDVALFSDRRGRPYRPDTCDLLREALCLLEVPRRDRQRESRFGEVARHGQSHRAKANEPNSQRRWFFHLDYLSSRIIDTARSEVPGRHATRPETKPAFRRVFIVRRHSEPIERKDFMRQPIKNERPGCSAGS